MRIQRDIAKHKLPYFVAVIDATDCYYYADIIENITVFDEFTDLKVAIAVADALFVLKNYNWASLQAMNDVDGGYDIRIYDKNYDCVYAAHERFKEKWIGK